jgi:hypothetical protein
MASLIEIGATTIRSSLLLVEGLPAAVTVNGRRQIELGAAADNTTPPYIRMAHLPGGGDENLNAARSFNMLWRVTAIGTNTSNCILIAGYIDQIINTYPTYIDGWQAWSPITSTAAVEDIVVRQNIQFPELGYVLRLRGSKRT